MKSRYVLLIEDNPDDVELVLRSLKRNGIGWRVETVSDGAAAVERLSAMSLSSAGADGALPCFILLDLKLPKLDGFDVLRQIRQSETTRHIPVVVLTSSREEKDIETSYKLGANSYIRKPVEFESFESAIAQLGKYWLELNESPS